MFKPRKNNTVKKEENAKQTEKSEIKNTIIESSLNKNKKGKVLSDKEKNPR